ncbi:unnamed protein product [Rhodiola kirilowii]
MKDLGLMRYYLGIEFIQEADGYFICQRKYASEILKRFGMDESQAVRTSMVPGHKLCKDEEGKAVCETYFKQVIGSLMYLTATRPDLMYSVSLISRFMSRPTEMHTQAAKRIMRYINGTLSYVILYRHDKSHMVGYTDSDYTGDIDDRKSTSGYVFMMSSGAMSWLSKKQPIVTLSTTEAEFVAAAGCASQVVWLRRITEEIGCKYTRGITIYCDNSSTIKLSKNSVMHRSRHIDVRFHFLREKVQDGVIEMVYCGTKEQIADVMTKPLSIELFEKFRAFLGVLPAERVN